MSQAPRIAYYQLAPKSFNALLNLSNGLRRDLLGAKLVDLVLLRVSQINGCAFCTGATSSRWAKTRAT